MMNLNTHLRRALEEAEANSQPIKFSGPLGGAFTEVLQQEYKKETPEDGEDKPALESQQLDNSAMVRLASMLTASDVPANQSALQVYGVSQAEVTEDDVVKVTQEIASLPLDDRSDFVVIVQETPEGQTEETVKELSGAMESLVRAMGCKTYPSLEAFAKARFG